MLAKTKLLALCCFALVFGAVLFFVGNQHNVAKASPTDCGDNYATFENSGALRWCDDWFVYDPWKSSSNNELVFKNGTDQGYYLVISKDSSGNPNVSGMTLHSAADGGKQYTNGAGLSGVYIHHGEQLTTTFVEKGQEFCSAAKQTDCLAYDGRTIPYKLDGYKDVDLSGNQQIQQGTFNGNAPFTTTQISTGSSQASQNDNKPNFEKDCENQEQAGKLSFILCPLLFSVSQSIDNIVSQDGILTNMLKVTPLAFGGGTTTNAISLQTQTNQIVALADVVYFFLFIVLIFANSVAIGVDNYTIKKTLPRLLAAAILTQFAYIICAILIDLGNIAGVTLPNFITGLGGINFQTGIHNFLSINGSGFSGLLSGLGAFFIILIAAFAILVVLILAVVYMAFRNLFIYVLVIASPLAFAAMVLPGTQKYFKKWGENFIKLILMYPIITSILALAGVISQSMFVASNNGANKPLALLAAILPVLAIAMIPKTFKWSGDLMELTAGAVGGYLGARAGAARGAAAGRAKDATKDSLKGLQSRAIDSQVRAGRNRTAALLGGRLPLDTRGRRREAAQKAGAYQQQVNKDAELEYANLNDPVSMARQAQKAADRLRRHPGDIRAQASLAAGVKALSQQGSKGIGEIDNIRQSLVQSGYSGEDWGQIINRSGAFGDINDKAPSVTNIGGAMAMGAAEYNDDGSFKGYARGYSGKSVSDFQKMGSQEVARIHEAATRIAADQKISYEDALTKRMGVNIESLKQMTTEARYAPQDSVAAAGFNTILGNTSAAAFKIDNGTPVPQQEQFQTELGKIKEQWGKL